MFLYFLIQPKHINAFKYILIACCTLVSSLCVCAQTYPIKPITLVVPYAVGGPTDNTARRLGILLSASLGANIVVENKVGAGTNIGATFVAKAPKDGYTLLLSGSSNMTVNPHVYKSLSYKLQDFAPISLISRQPIVLVASGASGVKSIAELIARAKSTADGVTYGSAGPGTLTNIVGEWIGRTLGIKMLQIPYKGAAQVNVDLVGGRVDLQVGSISGSLPMHKAGKIRILAIMADQRSTIAPDIPTFKELGYPDLMAYTTFGVGAPVGTPEPILEKLRRAIVDAVAQPEFVAALASIGETAVSSSSSKAYMDELQQEFQRWGRIIAPLNIVME
ncbi:MAG: Bug family tripartite tricarboxylate transporter substrate binding protein [Burkholderiaceae bacterium]